MIIKAFILSVFLHYPPDPDLELEYYFTSLSACEQKGRSIHEGWKHIEDKPGRFIMWSCTKTEEIEVQ